VSGSTERRIGSYRLLRLLMTGQTSQVYEAIRDGDPQKYAVKILLPELIKDREQIGYIKNEYAVGNTLKCERIVWAREMGKFHGGPYLVMEFFPYPNLKFYVQQTPDALPPILSKVIEQSAEALAYMHAKGWLHRDIKPDNFLVSPQGQVKLIDFALAQKPKGGLAKLFGGKQKIQGTRSYMSPEQIRGQPLDVRADIYSFGCTVHELVSGKCPFTGTDTQELLMKHLRSLPPALNVSNKNVTPEFTELILRTLAKKPADRPKSMDDFLLEFRRMRLFKEPPRSMAKQSASAE
jgi:serine/threonine protein kinase